MKRLLALFAAGFLFGSLPAHAQTPANCGVNFVPIVGVNCANVRAASYTNIILSLVPAASATDFFCISGSSTKAVHVRRIDITGTAGTLVSTPITLVHRVSLDTGTAATSTYLKAPAMFASTNPTPTAVVVAYNSTGGNPSITDTSPTYIRSTALTLGVSGTSVGAVDHLNWTFGTPEDAYFQGLDIPKGATAEQYCLNLNAVSVATGVIQGQIEWNED